MLILALIESRAPVDLMYVHTVPLSRCSEILEEEAKNKLQKRRVE
jgi:hypothetical protein